MPKHFLPADTFADTAFTVSGETARHLLTVLRLRPGDTALFCDGANTDYRCALHTLDAAQKTAGFTVLSKEACLTELPFFVTLYQCLPKGDKMDEIVQKCVELGAGRIVPVQSARAVSRVGDGAAKVTRWQRIAQSAAGQSMRGVIPVVSPPLSFADALSEARADTLWLAAYEKERRQSVRLVLLPPAPFNIGIWIGPEGGFTDEEMQALLTAGAFPVTLGRRVLRTETAGPAALAQVLCCWEEPI